jgi:hypothetical protein
VRLSRPPASFASRMSGAGRVGPRVDLDLGLDPERAGDDGALGVLGGLLGGELAAAHQLLDQRMVVGEPGELAVAHHVGAAVADVSDDELGLLQVDRGERRAHPRLLAFGLRGVVDPPVRGPHAGGEALLEARVLGVRGGQAATELLDGKRRGDLAGLGAAHPVGDHEQRHPHVRAVLVVASLATGVGLPYAVGGAEHHRTTTTGVIAGR